MDNRFGKIWLLSNLMRQVLSESSSAGSSPTNLEWLLWIDSDILILDGYQENHSQIEGVLSGDFVQDLLQLYGSQRGGKDLIVSDQRDSQMGDINAGLMLIRVCDWSVQFLDAWWNHEDAQQVCERESPPRFNTYHCNEVLSLTLLFFNLFFNLLILLLLSFYFNFNFLINQSNQIKGRIRAESVQYSLVSQ
jgi:hypothetical protein